MASEGRLRRIGALLALAGACLAQLPGGSAFAREGGAGAAVAPAPAAAAALVDDWQRDVPLAVPPLRIVSLAPHATELLFAVGAGPRVVAVDRASDLPPEVRRLPALSAYPRPDPERLLALRPDLVVLWGAGADRELVARIEALGLPVFVSEPRGLEDVATTIERFARLAPVPQAGLALASDFRDRLRRLRERYAGRTPVPVFVQVWSRPLITLSDRDSFAELLHVCGARNVFGEERTAAPQVGPEAVIRRAPRMVIGFRGKAGGGEGREPWARLGMLAPRGPFAHASVDDSIQRPTQRVLEPLSRLCEAIDEVRRSPPPQSSTGMPR